MRQLSALRKLLLTEHFEEIKEPEQEPEPAPEPEEELIEFKIDYANLPPMDFSKVPPEFKFAADQLAALGPKYSLKRASLGSLGSPTMGKKQ